MTSPKMSQLELPTEAIAAFCRHNQIRELSLFGSVLRADYSPDSDIDVLVVFEPEAEIGFIALARIARELSELFGRAVDLVPKDGLKPVIRESVLAGAEVIYTA
jgi:predicted nucleotidyltransferase